MGVYRKDNRWYIDYYLPDGKRKREAVTIPGMDPSKATRQDALKALSIRKAQIAEGKFEIAQTKKTVLFDKLVERYLEYSKTNKRSYRRDVVSSKEFLKFFRGKPLQQITSWLVEKYKAKRQKDISRYGKALAKATINRELACLKHMFTKAIEWGLISSNPAKKVKLFPGKSNKLRVVSEAEFHKLYQAASHHLKPVLLCAYLTGMRKGELVKLKWEDVDLADGYIYVKETKNNESRAIPINDTLMDTLLKLKKDSNSEYVFTTHKENPYISDTAWKKTWTAALRRSGIEKCRFHDLRHSFASRLVMGGVDIVTVQELMGHKDITMTKRYSHPTPQHKKQAVERLNLAGMDTYLDTKDNDEGAKAAVTS
jgi:integrase